MKFKVFGKTDVGMKRSKNEDSFGIDRQLGLFIVADGMGGHAAGEIASKMAIDVIMDYIKRTVATDEPYLTGFNNRYSRTGNRLSSAVILANQLISDTAANSEDWQGMGTTLVEAWLPDQDATLLSIAHFGDSRAYLLRHGRLKQLTTDPWINEIPQKYSLGDEYECKVLRVTEHGVFVELDDDVEGLVYSSEMDEEAKGLNEGDTIVARTIKVDLANKKIGLSMKSSGDEPASESVDEPVSVDEPASESVDEPPAARDDNLQLFLQLGACRTDLQYPRYSVAPLLLRWE